MDKLKKIIPNKIPTLGHQVVIPNSQFDELINIINTQTETINHLCDIIMDQENKLSKLEVYTSELHTSIKHLANVLKLHMEE